VRHRSGKSTALRPGTRVLAAGLLCLLAAVAPRAEPPSAPTLQPEQWRDLPPEQRHQMRQRYLRSLPEAERKRLRDRAERFRSLPESSQRALCRDFQAERGYLPPACRRLLGR
jgi:hypothetical protein